MKERLTVSEMAKLRGLTPETLRHYDRIGLFKPEYVDRATGYRYYSIYQFEILGTIKELRQLGMSIEVIKAYFEERNVKKSLQILENAHIELLKKIKELKDIERSIRGKVVFLRELCTPENENEIIIQKFSTRKLITNFTAVSTQVEFNYGVIELENMLALEKAPIIATNRLGVQINKNDLINERFEAPVILFASATRETLVLDDNLITIPEGNFVCAQYYGEVWNRSVSLKKMLDFIQFNGLEIKGNALQIAQVDISITSVAGEEMFELQIPIH
jgi:DNA-binding transcriptional MerR regulator